MFNSPVYKAEENETEVQFEWTLFSITAWWVINNEIND